MLGSNGKSKLIIKKTTQVRHDYGVSNLVYMDKTGIYYKPDNKKYGLYMITPVQTNGELVVQRGQVNKHIKLIRIYTQFK